MISGGGERDSGDMEHHSVSVLLFTQLRRCDDEGLMGHFVLIILLSNIGRFFVITGD